MICSRTTVKSGRLRTIVDKHVREKGRGEGSKIRSVGKDRGRTAYPSHVVKRGAEPDPERAELTDWTNIQAIFKFERLTRYGGKKNSREEQIPVGR